MRYSKATALESLRRLIAKRGRVSSDDFPSGLRRALVAYWGSVPAARKAARLPLMQPGRERTWTKERIVKEIRKLHRQGQYLSQGAVMQAGRNDLVVASSVCFGSWTRARTAAGVPFVRRKQHAAQSWDADTIVAVIRARHRDGETLAVTKAPKALVNAAIRHLGSWREAVEAAGLRYEDVALSRQYTDDELLDWLRKLARRRPQMTLADLDALGGHVVTCRRRFGSLAKAAAAAGLNNWPRRLALPLLSRDEVIAEIRSRFEAGRPVHDAAVRRDRGNQLRDSALKHFLSWSDALRASGLGALANDTYPRRTVRSINGKPRQVDRLTRERNATRRNRRINSR